MQTPHSSPAFVPPAGDSASAQAATFANIPDPAAEKHPPLVLVVDDEALVRWSLAQTLEEAGYEVVEAANGRAARALLLEGARPFAFMLLDLKLPDDHGLDILESAREHNLRCPALIMTAYGSPEAIERAAALGAIAVLAKPFDLQQVLGLVRDACPLTD